MLRTFSRLLSAARFFFIPFGIFLIVAGTVLALFSKEEIHLAINHVYSPFADAVMPWITWGGDGITVTVAVLLLFALDRKFAFFTGIACLLSSGITQLLKHTLFYGDPRPKLFFNGEHLRFVPGVKNLNFDTFPSGHTTVIFAFCACLALRNRNPFYQLLFFSIALLVGYSRIYLSQHFLSDVYGGSVIGTFSALLVIALAVSQKWLALPQLLPGDEK